MTAIPLYHIDFETFSTIDIQSVGVVKYAKHSSTEILCMAYSEDAEERIDLAVGPFVPEWMKGEWDLCAHNVDFEYNIIKYKLIPFGARMPRKITCTMAMAQGLNLPGALDDIPKALGIPYAKDKEGYNAMMRVSKPRKPTKNKPYRRHTPQTDPHYFNALYRYCVNDVRIEKALHKILTPLNKYEQRIYDVNFQINNEIGTPVDTHTLRHFVTAFEKHKARRKAMLPLLTDGMVDAVDKIQKIKDYCRSQGVVLDSLSKDLLPAIINNPDTPDTVREVLKIRMEAGGKAPSKYQAFHDCELDGRVYGMFRFCGASQTRRFSGARAQVHNLHRGFKDVKQDIAIDVVKHLGLDGIDLLYDDPMKVFATCLRGMIMTDNEHLLGVCDYSSIEAVVILWLAGDNDALDKIRNGVDLYIDLAESIYKRTVKKPSSERDLGKVGVLGCGFGMGVERFKEHCKKFGIIIDEKTARMVVEGYRNRYPLVVKFWYDLQYACMKAIKTGVSQSVGRLKIVMDQSSYPSKMQIILPCTARLTYWKPSVDMIYKPKWEKEVEAIHFYSMGGDESSRHWQQTSTWGGTLVENVVQSVARSILSWSLVRLYDNGFKPILHVHDEIGCELKKETALEDLKRMKQLMEQLPKWADGLPLTVGSDAWVGRRYKK